MKKKPQTFYKYPFKTLYVEWDDAMGNSAWHTEEEAQEWCTNGEWIIQEVGYLIGEDAYALYLAGFVKKEDNYTCMQLGALRRIPKNWIKKRKFIK